LFQIAQEPLLKELLKYVMRDESRHVAFGVLSLRDYYKDISASELGDREDFIIYASELMRDRLIGSDFALAMGWNVEEVQHEVLNSEVGRMFRSMLFQRITPNLKKLGLLTPKVRAAYTRLGLIHFEDFDSAAADRARGCLEWAAQPRSPAPAAPRSRACARRSSASSPRGTSSAQRSRPRSKASSW